MLTMYLMPMGSLHSSHVDVTTADGAACTLREEITIAAARPRRRPVRSMVLSVFFSLSKDDSE